MPPPPVLKRPFFSPTADSQRAAQIIQNVRSLATHSTLTGETPDMLEAKADSFLYHLDPSIVEFGQDLAENRK